MKNGFKTLAAFTAALLLAACADTPATTPQVKEIAPESLGLAGAPMPIVPAEWWKSFNDPQIDRLAEAMLRGSPTLTAALARIRAADADVASGEAADQPQVTLDGSEQRTLFPARTILSRPYGGSWRWFGQIAANFGWNLDFWGKQAALIEKARDSREAAAYDAAAARLALSGALAQTYIDLMLAYQDGDSADATVAAREAILKLTQGRRDSGLENNSAVEQAKKSRRRRRRLTGCASLPGARAMRMCHRRADRGGRCCSMTPSRGPLPRWIRGAAPSPPRGPPIFSPAVPTCWRRGPAWRRRPRGARPPMLPSIPGRQSGGAGGFPGYRPFQQPDQRRGLHHRSGPRPPICRSSTPAGSALAIPGPPPTSRCGGGRL